MSKPLHKIYFGDARNMGSIRDLSVHLIVTSPPYWQLKDYGSGQQIGYNDTYQDYINNLNLVWLESYRILHNGCRLCINIGDQFARAAVYGRYKVIPIRTEIIKFCEMIGFDYLGSIIWQKTTTTKTTGGASIMGSYPYPRNGILKLDYEFILIFKKAGQAPRVDRQRKETSKLSQEEWNTYFSGHWTFPGVKQHGHLAMYPEELPKRLIKMYSFAGDTILDPFLGSGTTILAAESLGRKGLGYEINREYRNIIRQRLNPFLDRVRIKTEKSIAEKKYQQQVQELPYLFRDPIKMNKQTDPKLQDFGSVIDDHTRKKRKYYRIKSVEAADRLVLNNGLNIQLLGIKLKPHQKTAALAYVKSLTSTKQVYYKTDPHFPETDGRLACYLYLANKTFINAHLIKKGYADPDREISYHYKERFLRYDRNPK